MSESPVTIVTGSRKGIGRYLAEYYCGRGHRVIGCSRGEAWLSADNYTHYALDVADEDAVLKMFADVSKRCGRVDNLINNAGIASMNHLLLTPKETVEAVFDTNVVGTFLFCREAAKLMTPNKYGRIVNFSTVAVPLKLAGEAAYAASKSAVVALTQILAKELGAYGITVNAVGPTPIKTDLIAGVPEKKLEKLIASQAIRRYGEYRDVTNAVDFFVRPESDFITGQILYLGGV